LISNEKQIIVVASDISRIKELENYTYKVRSMYFSSIAHELRTPLNSIIPLGTRLKNHVSSETGHKYLKIIMNSALHLSNLIEDALDMSRIENNKFEVNYEEFDIRTVVKDIADIMEF
jgi:signal transduction histidine kinase